MTELLVVLHFLGFTTGIGLGIANMITGIRAGRTGPTAAPELRQLQPLFIRGAALGLGLLWLTGLGLMASGPGTAILENPLFLLKMLAVLVLSGLTGIVLHHAAGNTPAPDPKRMRRLGIAMLTAAFAALILAVLTFR